MDYCVMQTEGQNPASTGFDQMSVLEAARLMNQMDREIPLAVEKALPEIAQKVEMAVESLKSGGRVTYAELNDWRGEEGEK